MSFSRVAGEREPLKGFVEFCHMHACEVRLCAPLAATAASRCSMTSVRESSALVLQLR